MDSIETPIVAPATPAQPVAQPVAQPITPPPVEPSYSGGGFLDKIGEFKLVEYFTFALFISASVYSIHYHRQALNKLNE